MAKAARGYHLFAKTKEARDAGVTKLLGAAKKRKPKPKGLVSFTRVLATASLPLAAGQRSLKLKPKKKKVGRPPKAFRVRLRITATDAAGNAAATTAAIRVSAPGKRR